jgi:hypothetical protein
MQATELAPPANSRRTLLGAALALLALTAAFLWPALSSLPDAWYTAADLTQDYALTELGDRHSVGNRMLGDTVLEMQPWLLFNKDELARGELPLWNPYNGAGLPHLANYQSAVFSPSACRSTCSISAARCSSRRRSSCSHWGSSRSCSCASSASRSPPRSSARPRSSSAA